MKLVKKILLIIGVALLVLQAFRPARDNRSGDSNQHLSQQYPMPTDVKNILTKACNDCHSNRTEYPWYTQLQPLGWWIDKHVKDGKKHLNFDIFTSYRLAKQYHKLEECTEMIQENEMPLSSYTLIHGNAALTDSEKQTLLHWFEALRDTMKVRYPADSLIFKRK